MANSAIKEIKARQVFTKRGHPGVEAIVTTEGGAQGRAVCTAGISVGTHEVKFNYDGGKKWGGKGVQKAVENVESIIAPALLGLDSANQFLIDHTMLDLCPDAKIKLGGNAIAAVSAACLKAGANSLGIPLYKHIGGTNAMYLPVPGVQAYNGHDRYGGGGVTTPGHKPTVSFMCHGFSSFEEATAAGWEIREKWIEYAEKLGFSNVTGGEYSEFFRARPGLVQSDEELWETMTDIICKLGFEGRVGIQMDVASDTYYNRETQKYQGLFDRKVRSRDELLDYYKDIVKRFPFVILEDPFNENDYESHALLCKEIDIQIVGDDLFTTNPERVLQGSKIGAANTVLLKVNQIGTITEALDMVQFAYRHGYGVMPCESRGEGVDLADYCVGINAASVRECAVDHVITNRLLEIEKELGKQAKFSGTAGLKGKRFEKEVLQ